MAILNFLYILDYIYSVFQTLFHFWAVGGELWSQMLFLTHYLEENKDVRGPQASTPASAWGMRLEDPTKKRKHLSFNSRQWMKSNKRAEFLPFLPGRGWVDLVGSAGSFSMVEVNLSNLQKDYLRMTVCKSLKSKVKLSSDIQWCESKAALLEANWVMHWCKWDQT